MLGWLFPKRDEEPRLPEPVKDIAELQEEIKKLKKEKETLEGQLRKLKHEKKLEEEDIKHMVKMREERLELDFEKKVAANTKEKDDEIAKVKDQYRDKVEEQLEKRATEIREMYDQILKRLPDVSVRLKGEA